MGHVNYAKWMGRWFCLCRANKTSIMHDQQHTIHRLCSKTQQYTRMYLYIRYAPHKSPRWFSNYAQLKHKSIMLCSAYTMCAELVVIAWRMHSPNAVLERRCALHFYTLSIQYIPSSLSQSSRTFCLYL